MLTNKQVEEIAQRTVELRDTAERMFEEQYKGLSYGTGHLTDAQFMTWWYTNAQYHGSPAWEVAVEKVSPEDWKRMKRIMNKEQAP